MTARLLRPTALERIEAAALLALAVVLYARLDAGWSRFALLFLAPDLAALGFLAGPTVGAACDNAAHAAVLPAALAAYGLLAHSWTALSGALIWLAHLALDRTLGYRLREPDGARRTPDAASR
jgi:hypothetical protein